MFPVTASYICDQYIKGGQSVKIADPKLIHELEKTAHKIIVLLHKGIRFTPTQPDVLRIEQIMLEEKVTLSHTPQSGSTPETATGHPL